MEGLVKRLIKTGICGKLHVPLHFLSSYKSNTPLFINWIVHYFWVNRWPIIPSSDDLRFLLLFLGASWSVLKSRQRRRTFLSLSYLEKTLTWARAMSRYRTEELTEERREGKLCKGQDREKRIKNSKKGERIKGRQQWRGETRREKGDEICKEGGSGGKSLGRTRRRMLEVRWIIRKMWGAAQLGHVDILVRL